MDRSDKYIVIQRISYNLTDQVQTVTIALETNDRDHAIEFAKSVREIVSKSFVGKDQSVTFSYDIYKLDVENSV